MDKNKTYTMFDAWVHLDKIANREPNAHFPAFAVSEFLKLVGKGTPPVLAARCILEPHQVNVTITPKRAEQQ